MADRYRLISFLGGRRVLLLLGGLYVASGLGWSLTRVVGTTTISELIIFVLFAGPGLAILYAGYRLPRFDIHDEFYPAVAGWCLGGLGAILAALGFYSLQPGEGTTFSSTPPAVDEAEG